MPAPAAVETPPPAELPIPAAPEKPPEPIISPIELKPTGDDAVRLQIFLDEANFGPGVIDGRPGKFTELAVRSWNEYHGYPLDSWKEVNLAAQKAVPNPFATAVIPESATKMDQPQALLQESRAGQVKEDVLPQLCGVYVGALSYRHPVSERAQSQ